MSKKAVSVPSPEIWDVAVIGGGAAGMMAAGAAGARGKSTVLLEKNEKLGKKLLISGGGRCNVTNNKQDVRTMLAKYKGKGKFLFSTFSQFSVKDTFDFFESRGVTLKEENDGRMFPTSNKSSTVWNALVENLKTTNVTVRTRCGVAGIQKESDTGVFTITLRNGEELKARSCVVATGGTSHPETGSTGEGYVWLREFGHRVVENNFALVPIALKDSWAKKLSGVTLPDVKLTVFSDGKKQSVHRGKMLFTHFGASGPVILTMSKEVGELLLHSAVTLSLDLFPQDGPGEFKARLQHALQEESNKKLKNVLAGLVPSTLVESLLAVSGVDGDIASHSVSTEDRAKLVAFLKAVLLQVDKLLGSDKAVISAGGVPLEEVDTRTMESRLVKGLYLIGDVLDIDRPSGGYSFQLCWSEGFVAGQHC